MDVHDERRETMSKYSKDKDRMDEIAFKLKDRQDIWQDRFIYWMAVAIGHILEWIAKTGGETNNDHNGKTDSKH